MSNDGSQESTAPAPKRHDPQQPSIQERCKFCRRMQALNDQLAEIADHERTQRNLEHERAEMFRRMWQSAVSGVEAESIAVPTDEPKAA